MQFGSVCSGIEAASVAWHTIGWQAAWLSEIEPFPCAVLANHYPSVPNLGDMTTIARRVLTEEVPAPDVFCGGTPCQAFSVAGLRESLADERGNLTLKFVEIADAIDHVRARRGDDECVIFWENVFGVLSTKDNAFGCFLAGLAGENDPLEPPGGKWTNAGCVSGPQRTVAWRVLDAQYFGVAQRRRRVFVIASARKGFDPAQVLFEWDGVRRDTAPSREARQTAPTIPARSTAGGGLGTDFDLDGGVITMAHDQGGAEIGFDRGPTLTCNHEAPIAVYADALHPCEFCGYRFDHDKLGRYGCPNCCGEGLDVTHTLRGEGFDASEDGTGRDTPLGPVETKDVRYAYYSHDYANDRITDVSGINPALTARDTASGNLNVAVPVAFDQHYQPSTTAQTLIAGGSGGRNEMNHPTVFTAAMQVRRLTPTECERLQGFPDGYTAIPWRKKPADQCPDGPRYRALGNSWAIPVVRWIGQRIDSVLSRGQTRPSHVEAAQKRSTPESGEQRRDRTGS